MVQGGGVQAWPGVFVGSSRGGEKRVGGVGVFVYREKGKAEGVKTEEAREGGSAKYVKGYWSVLLYACILKSISASSWLQSVRAYRVCENVTLRSIL